MTQLTVRDLSQDVLDVLRAEAEGRHTSLNAILCAALEEYADRRRRLRVMQRLLPRMDALSEEILSARGGVPTTGSASLLREDRAR